MMSIEDLNMKDDVGRWWKNEELIGNYDRRI